MRPYALSPEVRRQSTTALEGALAAWRAQSLLQHATTVVALVMVVVVAHWAELAYPEVLRDERAYAAAFEAVGAGRDAYDVSSYLYPPIFAEAGGWLSGQIGTMPTIRLIRAANVLGAVACAWLATVWVPLALRWRLVVSAGVLLASPAVAFGFECGNLSLAVSGVMALALMFWRTSPVVAGVTLGVSVAVKPVAPLAIAVLGAHHPAPPTRRHGVAGAAGLVVTMAALLAVPGLMSFLQRGGLGIEHRSASLHRLAYLVGGPGWSIWVTALVAVVALVVVRRIGPLGRLQQMAVAIAATITATPMVWGHTHVATIPIQGAALAVLWQRRGRRVPFEALLVGLALGASHLAQGITGVYGTSSAWLEAIGVLPPTAAPIVLAGYLVWAAEPV